MNVETHVCPCQVRAHRDDKEKREVTQVEYIEVESNFHVTFKNVPIFLCKSCETTYIPDYVRRKMQRMHREDPNAKELTLPSIQEIYDESFGGH